MKITTDPTRRVRSPRRVSFDCPSAARSASMASQTIFSGLGFTQDWQKAEAAI